MVYWISIGLALMAYLSVPTVLINSQQDVGGAPLRITLSNCDGAGSVGSLLIHSPRRAATYGSGDLFLELSAECPDGTSSPPGFRLSIDEVPYQLTMAGRVIPDASCLDQSKVNCPAAFGPFESQDLLPDGSFRAPIQVEPGSHRLLLLPSLQGNNLPGFERVVLSFRVSNRALADTGIGITQLAYAGLMCLVVGFTCSWAARVGRRRGSLSGPI